MTKKKTIDGHCANQVPMKEKIHDFETLVFLKMLNYVFSPLIFFRPLNFIYLFFSLSNLKIIYFSSSLLIFNDLEVQIVKKKIEERLKIILYKF